MALEQVFQARGQRLGFNCKLLFEMGEEIGSPGLADLCQQHKQELAADILSLPMGHALMQNVQRCSLALAAVPISVYASNHASRHTIPVTGAGC